MKPAFLDWITTYPLQQADASACGGPQFSAQIDIQTERLDGVVYGLVFRFLFAYTSRLDFVPKSLSEEKTAYGDESRFAGGI